jgi:hypothetical protein
VCVYDWNVVLIKSQCVDRIFRMYAILMDPQVLADLRLQAARVSNESVRL